MLKNENLPMLLEVKTIRIFAGEMGSNWKKAPGGHPGSVSVLLRDVGAGYMAVFTC